MAQDTYLVAYDGHDRNVLDAAQSLAKQTGAQLLVVHVLVWSPYTFLTNEELEERHKVRTEELERAHSVILGPVLAEIRGAGVAADGIAKHGQPSDVIVSQAREAKARLIFVGQSSSYSKRMFGAVTSSLAQDSHVPLVIVP